MSVHLSVRGRKRVASISEIHIFYYTRCLVHSYIISTMKIWQKHLKNKKQFYFSPCVKYSQTLMEIYILGCNIIINIKNKLYIYAIVITNAGISVPVWSIVFWMSEMIQSILFTYFLIYKTYVLKCTQKYSSMQGRMCRRSKSCESVWNIPICKIKQISFDKSLIDDSFYQLI